MNIPAYIINLKHRIDRRNHIGSEVLKITNTFNFVEGIVDGTKTCFQSQKKCIKLAKENKLPYVLVLEDDATFVDGSRQLFQISFDEVQSINWDMLYLGANLQTPAIRISKNLLKLNGAFTAHAYMVHERFYDFILNLPHTCEMDVHYCWLMPTHNVYMCDPMIAYQLPSYSDLQEKFTDYFPTIYNNYLKYTPPYVVDWKTRIVCL